jgi:antitoxin FitA
MASITIRDLDEQTTARLRVRAAHGKRSMEEEATHILRTALARNAGRGPNLAEVIRRRFGPLGGVDLQLPERELRDWDSESVEVKPSYPESSSRRRRE